MAHALQQSNSTPKAPDLIAWNVTERGDQTYWNRIGASWSHKDGKGFTIELSAIPVSGRIVLRQPKEPDLFADAERSS